MKVNIVFPLPKAHGGYPTEAKRNWKEIREQLLLDTTGSGVEKALVAAARQAVGPNQTVYVSRTFGPAGRLSVWIVDETTSKDRRKKGNGIRARKNALRETLARVRI